MNSKVSLIICACILLYAGSIFYPKWKKSGTEATISWDASGYYMYLPAIFIYKDLKKCSFQDEMLKKYGPTPDFQQAFKHSSGNYVMKYSLGQALQMLPFFTIAHIYSSISENYENDGFSRPYQFMIYLGSFLIAFLGLFVLRKILILYFTQTVTSVVLLSIVLASNYLDYAAINGAMTHNNLFTIYALLIWLSIKFHNHKTFGLAFGIGALIGIAALTRPTEIIAVIIPLFWGIKVVNYDSIKEKIKEVFVAKKYFVLMGITSLAIGSLQLIYWRYVSGDWIVYSYEDQGFSWLNPHIWDGLFSYKSGWLIYTPIFIFSLVGFYYLYKNFKDIFWVSFIFAAFFSYVAFAWDIWWYGGSLGQRAMIQSYPIFSIALGAFYTHAFKSKSWKYIVVGFIILFSYYNLWLTYQAHGGGLFRAGQMTKSYFWEVVGTFEKNEEDLKLLDNKDSYDGKRYKVKAVYKNDFEDEKSKCTNDIEVINGEGAFCLNKENQFSPIYKRPLSRDDGDWVRATATFRCKQKEWNFWQMSQFIIKFSNNDQTIRTRSIRIFRLLQDGETQRIHIDAKIPKRALITDVGIYFWNADGNKELMIDDLVVEVFSENEVD